MNVGGGGGGCGDRGKEDGGGVGGGVGWGGEQQGETAEFLNCPDESNLP